MPYRYAQKARDTGSSSYLGTVPAVIANGLALVPPGAGRRFAASRLIRLGDVLPSGEIRLDTIARYLQDVAADDGRDAGIESRLAWLVRKTLMGVLRRPRFEERLDLVTWASGSGSRWAERRTTLSAAGVPVVEAASLWVCVDLATMRPVRLPERFWALYGEAAENRTVSPRLTHPDLPSSATLRPWPLRVSDFDMLGHVNNAVTWAAVEDELDRVGGQRAVVKAELEYREPVDCSEALAVASRLSGDVMHLWLTAAATTTGASGATVLASAIVTLA